MVVADLDKLCPEVAALRRVVFSKLSKRHFVLKPYKRKVACFLHILFIKLFGFGASVDLTFHGSKLEM